MSRRRTVAVLLVVWALVVAATSSLAWLVIDHAGQGVLSATRAVPAVDASAVGRSSPPTPTPTPTGRTSTRTPRAGATTSTRPVSPAHVSTAPPPSARRTTVPPRPTATRSVAPPAPPRAPQPVSAVARARGGSVGVSCAGSSATLLFATPKDGWLFEVEHESGQVHVKFERHSGGEGESQVEAHCGSAGPVFDVQESGGDAPASLKAVGAEAD